MAATQNDRRSGSRLRVYNLAMGILHAAQGLVVLALATDFSLPVIATYMTGPPGASAPEVEPLFDLSLAWGVAIFFFLSALAHFLIVTPGIYGWYQGNLSRQRNYARWIEYSLSSSVMVVLIAMLVGIADVAALIALAGVNASMILFGLLQEKYETPGASCRLAPLLVWGYRGSRALGRHRHLPVQPWVRGIPARLRLRHLLLAVRLLQCLRNSHGPPIQEGRALGELQLRGIDLRPTQPDSEVGPRMAGVRRHPGRLIQAPPRPFRHESHTQNEGIGIRPIPSSPTGEE